MNDFYQLNEVQQTQILIKLASSALSSWGVNALTIELIKYRENAVFKVETVDNRFALRIHRAGYHDPIALRSELQWLSALGEEGIPVPIVIPTTDQQLLAQHSIADIPEPRFIDLFEWIEGKHFFNVEGGLGKDVTKIETTYLQIGRVAAQLHNQASQWQLPKGFKRHAWDEQGLVGEQPFWGRFWELSLLTKEQRSLLLEAREKVSKQLQSLDKTAANYSLIHADFVPENLMTDGDSVRLIDFDDAGFGWHLFELATALYFIQDDPHYLVAQAALIAGYRQLRSLSDQKLQNLDTFLTARSFTYLGWIQDRQETQTAREHAPELIDRACRQAQAYVSTAN